MTSGSQPHGGAPKQQRSWVHIIVSATAIICPTILVVWALNSPPLKALAFGGSTMPLAPHPHVTSLSPVHVPHRTRALVPAVASSPPTRLSYTTRSNEAEVLPLKKTPLEAHGSAPRMRLTFAFLGAVAATGFGAWLLACGSRGRPASYMAFAVEAAPRPYGAMEAIAVPSLGTLNDYNPRVGNRTSILQRPMRTRAYAQRMPHRTTPTNAHAAAPMEANAQEDAEAKGEGETEAEPRAQPQATAEAESQAEAQAQAKTEAEVEAKADAASVTGSCDDAKHLLLDPPPKLPDVGQEREIRPGVFEGGWVWQGHYIRYQRAAGRRGPAMLLVHGFGSNCDHWRKNIAVLAEVGPAWAVDLLGYGYSAKPAPDPVDPNRLYNFGTWARQIRDFVTAKIGQPTFLVTNSAGGMAGMQAALDAPELVAAIVLTDVSMRELHFRRLHPMMRPLVWHWQRLLRTTGAGHMFFRTLATPRTLRAVLQRAYGDPAAVTEELVELLLRPGLQPGAEAVFLDSISYSTGPLPEELLQRLQCPVLVLWGEADPWERVEQGRALQRHSCVEDVITLPGVGHCPHDEAPHLVNPLVAEFVRRHQHRSTGVAL